MSSIHVNYPKKNKNKLRTSQSQKRRTLRKANHRRNLLVLILKKRLDPSFYIFSPYIHVSVKRLSHVL